MKKLSPYYTDGRIRYNRKKGSYFYQDENNYLLAKGIYNTKIKEENLPDYYIKLWLYPRHIYLSLKDINDIAYKPNFIFNHWRKDDSLYISYKGKLNINEKGYCDNWDILVYGIEIDHFVNKLEKYGYDKVKIKEIKSLMNKKDKWFKYWDKHNWNGNYSFTSNEIWKEILGDE